MQSLWLGGDLLMRTEEEIKNRIQKAQMNKANAKSRGDDNGYVRWSFVARELKWVISDDNR